MHCTPFMQAVKGWGHEWQKERMGIWAGPDSEDRQGVCKKVCFITSFYEKYNRTGDKREGKLKKQTNMWILRQLEFNDYFTGLYTNVQK